MASLVVNAFPQAFLEVLHHSLQHVGRNCCHFFPDVLFQIHRCPWFLFIHLALEISSEEEVLRLGTPVPMNIEVPKKYPLSQDRIVVFEIRLHSKSPMLYRPALHGNWNAWVSLEGCSRTNSPHQRFHSQLCYQIVRYFCRTLYYRTKYTYVFQVFSFTQPAPVKPCMHLSCPQYVPHAPPIPFFVTCW